LWGVPRERGYRSAGNHEHTERSKGALATLISFDIDGTLALGDPPGPISNEMVRRAREHGCIIGTCSDRFLPGQRLIWNQLGVEPDFVSLKHMLSEVKTKFEAVRYIHTGDTNMDRQAAKEAGFEFMDLNDASAEPWLT
jgi:predicted mannosyl-3-phosphoglycerate phosphatase (HAD superfamily)